ncbi:MAG: ATP synthase F0 subunit C [Verrucomicrobia bacterium]|nr:ATP synthase F0 subunit C [Verrucomicrobiota bacterium]MBU1736475.1 ATP synthase F0 subunit C [Verrucomicrobiota bacterium]MBU1857242.1 ATP synthase F0 subunit C [Verrucomicrobiota bacterium]
MDILTASVVVAGFSMAIATIGTGIAQGMAVNGAMQGISRQPEAAGTIGTNLIIGLAFIESLAIYALVVVLLLLFANPFTTGAKAQVEMQNKVSVLKLKVEELQLQGQLDTMQKSMPTAAATK